MHKSIKGLIMTLIAIRVTNLLRDNLLERYYMGRHRIQIIERMGKKALVKHLEKGYVGNKRVGYKEVFLGITDIVLIRHCYKEQKRGNDYK